MTIDEKIKQAAEEYAKNKIGEAEPSSQFLTTSGIESLRNDCRNFFLSGADFVKCEMLADMQKMADALKFYADESSWSISETYKQFNRIDDQDLEYKPGCGRYDLLAGKKARQTLAELNAKYKEQK